MVMEDSRQQNDRSPALGGGDTGYPGGVMNSGPATTRLPLSAATAAAVTAENANPPRLRVREATPSKDAGDLDDDLEDDVDNEADVDDEAEADDESSSVSVPAVSRSAARISPSTAATRSPRRERRHSTVINPYPMLAAHGAAAAVAEGGAQHPIASAIPSHLDLTVGEPGNVKRRSKSTAGQHSVSPPTKALRSGELEDLPLRPYHYLQHYHHHHRPPSSQGTAGSAAALDASPQPNFYARPPASGLSYTPTTRHHSVSGAHHRPPSSSHVRFRGDDYGSGSGRAADTSHVVLPQCGRVVDASSLLRYPYSNLIAPTGIWSTGGAAGGPSPQAGPATSSPSLPVSTRSTSGSGGGGNSAFRCHHKIAEENHDPAKWEKSGGGAKDLTTTESGQQQELVVKRTNSNPEMECCPLCTARNQCEILVRRTYSKVAPPRNNRNSNGIML